MSGIWYVETVLSTAGDWKERSDTLMDALQPVSGTFGETPDGLLSVRVAVEAADAFEAVGAGCAPVMDALLSAGVPGAVIRSTEVLSEAEMDAFLARHME